LLPQLWGKGGNVLLEAGNLFRQGTGSCRSGVGHDVLDRLHFLSNKRGTVFGNTKVLRTNGGIIQKLKTKTNKQQNEER
jgi:hypothetical protein